MKALPTRTGSFRTAKGDILANVYEIHPAVVAIGGVRSGSSRIQPGQILIRNQALKQRAPSGSEWMHYQDLYSALRGMVHALRSGGAQPDVRNGELQELEILPELLRRCSRLLFSTAAYSRFAEEAAAEGVEYIVETLQHRRESSLVTAYLDALRGMQPQDTLGRRNPAAGAMALGGAIHQLAKREQGLLMIMGLLNTRVYRISELIYAVHDTYESLLESVGGRNLSQVSDQAVFFRISHKATYRRAEARRAVNLLESYITDFDRIVTLPQIRNAARMRNDLVGMRPHLRILSDHWDTQAAQMVKQFAAVIRQGILWFMVRHYIETELRAPISWMLGDRDRERKIIRKATRTPKHVLIEAVPPNDSERCQAILGGMGACLERLRLCSDDLMKQKIKQFSLIQMGIALNCARHNQWAEAESRLDLITSKL